MLCDFEPIDEADATADYRCRRCGLIVRGVKVLPLIAECGAAGGQVVHINPPLPGSELSRLLAELGLGRHCEECNEHMTAMNAWGIAGCREHIEEITAWLRESYERLGWQEKLKAAASAIGSGLALMIDPRDPPRSLVELAIKRAEGKEAID